MSRLVFGLISSAAIICVGSASAHFEGPAPKKIANTDLEVNNGKAQVRVRGLKVNHTGVISGNFQCDNDDLLNGFTGAVMVVLVDSKGTLLFPLEINKDALPTVYADGEGVSEWVGLGHDNTEGRIRIKFPKDIFEDVDPDKSKVAFVYNPKGDDWSARIKEISEGTKDILEPAAKAADLVAKLKKIPGVTTK